MSAWPALDGGRGHVRVIMRECSADVHPTFPSHGSLTVLRNPNYSCRLVMFKMPGNAYYNPNSYMYPARCQSLSLTTPERHRCRGSEWGRLMCRPSAL